MPTGFSLSLWWAYTQCDWAKCLFSYASKLQNRWGEICGFSHRSRNWVRIVNYFRIDVIKLFWITYIPNQRWIEIGFGDPIFLKQGIVIINIRDYRALNCSNLPKARLSSLCKSVRKSTISFWLITFSGTGYCKPPEKNTVPERKRKNLNILLILFSISSFFDSKLSFRSLRKKIRIMATALFMPSWRYWK